MWILLIGALLVYAVLFFAFCSACVALYRKYARGSKLAALGLSLLCVILPLLVMPIPEHGGISFVFMHVYDELVSRWERPFTTVSGMPESRNSGTFIARQKQRFSGTVELAETARLSDTWRQVTVARQAQGWHDTVHKLVWSDWLRLPEALGRPSLDIAKLFCRNHPPQGYWALANEAENSLLWKSGGEDLLPGTAFSTVSYIPDDTLRIELPAYRLRRAAGQAQGQSSVHAAFAVRCVALADGAPAGGYTRKDIPLEDWNRYQLQKLAH